VPLANVGVSSFGTRCATASKWCFTRQAARSYVPMDRLSGNDANRSAKGSGREDIKQDATAYYNATNVGQRLSYLRKSPHMAPCVAQSSRSKWKRSANQMFAEYPGTFGRWSTSNAGRL